MRQLEFGQLKKFLVVTPQDTLVPDEYVAVWVDQRVLDVLISRQFDRSLTGRPVSISDQLAELLDAVGNDP